MKWSRLVFIGLLIVWTSCNAQTNKALNIQSENSNKPRATGDTVKELSNNIMVIHQDKKNNYWFGSWQDGLYKYDGKILIHFTEKDGWAASRVEEIKEDKQGNVYINTSNGVYQYNGNGFLKLTETMGSESDWKLNPDDLWFKSPDYSGSVYRFDGHHLYKLKIPKTAIGEDYIQKHRAYSNPYAVYCVYTDSKQNVWFGTATLGACRYNGKSFDWISEPDVTEMHEGPANGVRSIAEDKQGDFWFNTAYRYKVHDQNVSTETHTGTSSFYERIKSIGCLDGKKEGDLNEFISILKDDSGNLWMALYLEGVWNYDGEKISHYPIQLNGKNLPVFCLFKDKQGDLWLGTHENGVLKFNGKTFVQFVP